MSVPGRLIEAQIMQACGLVPWSEAFRRSLQALRMNRAMLGRYWYRSIGRRSGRTTRMLVKAVERSQDGTVLIQGRNPPHSASLCAQARDMAEVCGIKCDMYQFLPSHRWPDLAAYTGRIAGRFCDHSARVRFDEDEVALWRMQEADDD